MMQYLARLIGGMALLAVLTASAWAGFEFTPAGDMVRPEARSGSGQPTPIAPRAEDGGALPPAPENGQFDALLDATEAPAQPPKPQDRGRIVEGAGQNEPLALAMQDIVPADYQVAYDTAVDAGQPVSWTGGVPWRDLVGDVLSPLGLSSRERDDVVYVEPEGRAPSVRQNAAADITASAQAPVDVVRSPEPLRLVGLAPQADAAVAPQPQQLAQAAASPAPGANRAWIVEEGKTLREVLGIWTDAAGWQLVWDTGRDYRIQASASFTGDFRQAAGQLIRAFAAAQPPVVGTFYRNRTLVITTLADGDVE